MKRKGLSVAKAAPATAVGGEPTAGPQPAAPMPGAAPAAAAAPVPAAPLAAASDGNAALTAAAEEGAVAEGGEGASNDAGGAVATVRAPQEGAVAPAAMPTAAPAVKKRDLAGAARRPHCCPHTSVRCGASRLMACKPSAATARNQLASVPICSPPAHGKHPLPHVRCAAPKAKGPSAAGGTPAPAAAAKPTAGKAAASDASAPPAEKLPRPRSAYQFLCEELRPKLKGARAHNACV